MTESGEPAMKKIKIDPVNPVFQFLHNDDSKMKELKAATLAIEEGLSICMIRTLKVISTNAHLKKSFSRSDIELCKGDRKLPFGCIFTKGLTVLNNLLEPDVDYEANIPDDIERQKALLILLEFLMKLGEGEFWLPYL